MTPRRLLVFLGGLGLAGLAMLLWPAPSYAQTPNAPFGSAPVAGQPVAGVTAPVVKVVRAAPVAGPIVSKVGKTATVHRPDTLPIVSDVLRSLAPQPAPSSAPRSVGRVGPHSRPSTVSRAFSNWPARIEAVGGVRPTPTATISLAPARSRTSNTAIALVGSTGVPSGVTADGQTRLRGDGSAASIAHPAAVAAAGWKRFDVAASRAPRPGVARDLSPPG